MTSASAGSAFVRPFHAWMAAAKFVSSGFCPGDRGGHTVECEFRLRCPGAGRRDRHDPAVSPLYADLSELPPVYIFQGDHDFFLRESPTPRRSTLARYRWIMSRLRA